MTSPFQSIIGTPENAVGDQVERNEVTRTWKKLPKIYAQANSRPSALPPKNRPWPE